MVPVQERVGRDDQVVVGDVPEALTPVGPVKDQELQIRHEACGLAPPVADQARRHHQKTRAGSLLLQMPVGQQGERLHGLAEPHVVGKHAAEAAVGERPQPAVAGALVGAQLPAQRGGGRHFRGLGERPETGAEFENLPSPGPRRAAALQRLGQLEQPARLGPVETEQPLRLQKGLCEAREPRRVDRKPRSVLEPGVEDPSGQMAPDVEAFLQPSPFVHRQGINELEDDRRDVERTAVRLEREAKREPVGAPCFQRGRERDRSLVQVERPRPFDLDTPALGAELRNRLRGKTDAGPGRCVVFVADRREDDVRFAQLARQAVVVTQQFVILVAVPPRRLPQRFLERRFARAIAPDDGEAVLTGRRNIVSSSGTNCGARAVVGDLQAGTRIDDRSGVARAAAVIAIDISGQPVRAAVERQHRHRPDIRALLDVMKPRHGRMLADPGQFRRDRGHRPAPHRRCGREPGCHPRFQRRFCHTDLAAFGIDKKRCRKRQQRHGRSGAIARHDFLLARLADRPCEFATPRLRPRQGGAPDLLGSRAAGIDNLADEADQLFALGPAVAPRISAVGVVIQLPEDRGVFHGHVLLRPGRIPFLKLPEIGADRSVFAQISPVGRDVHASHRIAMDHVEQMLLRP